MMDILKERGKTHGNYEDTANIAQSIKYTMRNSVNWGNLEADQRETLDLIATKVARILSGDYNEPDHMRDIVGYASLVLERLEQS